jgi:transposase
MAKELLRSVYAAPDVFAARIALERFFDWAATVEITEVTRLATTIDRWRDEVLAYFRTGRSSSGDRAARGFRNMRMLLKTAVDWQTPTTPRLRGRAGQSDPATPAFIA